MAVVTHTYTPRGHVRTSAGIVIGAAHVPPPHRIGAEAERIQAALLRKAHKPKHYVIGWAGAMKPRRRLPTLTPTTRMARLLAWFKSLF